MHQSADNRAKKGGRICFWYNSLVLGRQLNYRRLPHLSGDEDDLVLYGRRKRYALLTLLFSRRGVLRPKHVTVFTANFMSPPTVGVAI
jgi:hypothetical protein